MKHKLAKAIILALASSPLLVHASSESWMHDAATLLKNGEAEKAMSILSPRMENNAGDPDYDFLLGQTAYALEQPNLAVFALERTVLTKPSQDGARLVLAKSYIQLGEHHQAKKELNYLLKTSKNKRYKHLSQTLLSDLQNPRQKSSNTHLFVNLGMGKDTNANSATELDTFLGINLDENSKATASQMMLGQFIATASIPMSKRVSLNTNGIYFKQNFRDAEFVNTTSTAASAGLNFQTSQKMLESLEFSTRHTKVNNRENNQQFASQFTHRQLFGKTNTLSSSIRVGQTEYAKNVSNNSVTQLNAGFQYQYKTRTKTRDLFITSLSAITGQDSTKNSESILGRKFTGLQAGILLGNASGNVNVVANMTYMNSKYNEYLSKDRNENNMAASFKINVKLNNQWSVTPGLSYAKNKSTIDLFDFERTQVNFVISHQII